MDNLGILLIDMQNHFIEQNLPNEVKELIDSQKRLLNFAFKNGVPIFVLEYNGLGETIEELKKELSKNRSYFINKYRNNGFLLTEPMWESDSLKEEYQNKEFQDKLIEEQIKNLIITGVNKDACVLETTEGAKRRNYNIFTSEELMNKRKMEVGWFARYSNHYPTLDELFLKIR